MMVVTAAQTATTAVIGAERAQRLYNWVNGNAVANETFSYTDANSKTKTIKKGQEISLKNASPELKAHLAENQELVKTQGGTPESNAYNKTIPNAQISNAENPLETASNVVGDAEMFGGLVTLVSQGISYVKGSVGNIASRVASFGARTMPGVGIAYGVVDSLLKKKHKTLCF